MNYHFYDGPFPTLPVGSDYYLREQLLEDAPAFYAYYSDPAVSRYILATVPKSVEDASSEIHYCRNLFYHKTGIYWSIVAKATECMIGAVGLYVNIQHNRAEICYDLNKNYWRRGIMTRSLEKIMCFVFQHMRLDRIEAVTVRQNLASINFLKKLGYVHEGRLLNYRQYNHQPHDVEIFSITPALYYNRENTFESEQMVLATD